ncbi:MAG: alpha-ketoglutarate-dependent dioxygenase AlkB [Halioglobus sp.]|nr:alpha-ketoglutarate-dependent dioxygenase AlkB [Halioglobus sp.]
MIRRVPDPTCLSIQPHVAPEIIDLPDGELAFYCDAGLRDTDQLLTRLIDTVHWRQEHITLFGKTHPQPRLIAWHGDEHAHYSYSGLQHSPLPWTRELAALREALQRLCDASFNSVLLNLYRDGADSMGLHADDEPELGPQPVIASLSLGATRRMYFQHKTKRHLPTQQLDLPDGSLLIMRGTTQQHWKHGIRKARGCRQARINLTFRLVDTQVPGAR